jgi:hypothetical protein
MARVFGVPQICVPNAVTPPFGYTPMEGLYIGGLLSPLGTEVTGTLTKTCSSLLVFITRKKLEMELKYVNRNTIFIYDAATILA